MTQPSADPGKTMRPATVPSSKPFMARMAWRGRWWIAAGVICIGACMFFIRHHPVTPLPAFVYPGKEWAVLTPDQAGMKRQALKELAQKLKGSGCVTRNGYLVYAWGHPDSSTDQGSVSKVVLSHFILVAVAEGRISSLDEPVSRHEPALAALSAKDGRITWRHLLYQTACYGQGEEPGTAFDYNDFTNVLTWRVLFEKVYGERPEDATPHVLEPRLALPLQFENHPHYYSPDGKAWVGHLMISTRDLCRFGLLYLKQGRWENRQILPPEVARAAVTSPLANSIPRTGRQTTPMLPGQLTSGAGANQEAHLGSYSFMWWINGVGSDGQRLWPDAPADTFGGFGYGGNSALVVIPSLGIVAAWGKTTLPITAMSRDGRRNVNEALKMLVDAVLR